MSNLHNFRYKNFHIAYRVVTLLISLLLYSPLGDPTTRFDCIIKKLYHFCLYPIPSNKIFKAFSYGKLMTFFPHIFTERLS